MFGPGRPAKRPEILGVRELSRDEVLATPRQRPAGPKQLKDNHHRIARLYAMGMRTNEIMVLTGYSAPRLSMLRSNPAMKQLIENYRKDVHEEWQEEARGYYAEADRLRTASLRQIADQLDRADESGEEIPISTLLRVHDSLADRTGYPKRKENVNLNIDFADRLEKARQRSAKVIELRPGTALLPPASVEEAPAAPRVDARAARGPELREVVQKLVRRI